MKRHESSRQRQMHVVTALRKSASKCGALLAALLTSIAFGATPVAADTCSNLTANVKLRALPNTTITAATTVSGTFTPPDGTPAIPGLPSFCRVAATLTPSPTSDIKVEVWLPTTGWNGRLQSVGNGGLAGSISYTAMAPAIEAGYASASTDTGHVASDLTWLTDPEREADNGYRAIHLMTVFAKDVIHQFYRGPVKYSYFNGCSTGGGQGVGEAQRYPDDYDGILAGALQIFATHLRAVDIWDFQAADNNPASNLPASALTLLTQAVLKHCGDQYAIADGFLNDPLTCHFKPEQIQCQPGQDPMTCLTTPQVQAAEKVYGGLLDLRTQKLIWPGLLRGSENPGGGASWLGQSINGPNPSSVVDFFYGVYDNFSLNFHTLDPVAAALLADETFPYVDHIDTNLVPFIHGGGKLLIYHGEADQLISTRSTVDYYGSVVEKVRHQGGNPSSGKSLEETEESVRLFLVPGMGHCTGGPGPYTFDAFDPLVSWVEQGKAPDEIIASHITSGITTFTRPLCPYPQQAEWTGSGERTDASNWVCVKGPADFDNRFYDYWDAKFGISNGGSDHD